jgi:hypothetical protein
MSETEAGQVGSDELKEQIAHIIHEQWSHWMRYLFSRTQNTQQGFTLIPQEWADRWKKQMDMPYARLSEKEKDSDRELADGYIILVNNELQNLREQLAVCDACCKERVKEVAKTVVDIYKLNEEITYKDNYINQLESDIGDTDALIVERAELLEKLELLKVSEGKKTEQIILLEKEIQASRDYFVSMSEYVTDTEETISSAMELLARKKKKEK